MKHPFSRNFLPFLAAFLLSSATLVSCARTNSPEKIDFELTGRVLDKETKEPIEGAYVIAKYMSVVAGPAAVASHCVKTKGMYTGKDGKFHFPVEKRDGYSPLDVEAIKIDYSYWTTDIKPDHIHHQQTAEAYTDRNVYLIKQDPNNPSFFGGAVDCLYAKNSEDVAASVEYYKIKKAQSIKYNRDKGLLESIDSWIQQHEKLNGRPPEAIVEPAVPVKQ